MFQAIPVETVDGKFPLNQLGQVIQKNPSLIIINLSMSPQVSQLFFFSFFF